MQIHPKIAALEGPYFREEHAGVRVGNTIRVHYRIKEGDKERIQVFQGVVIRRRRGGIGSTFTVRKVSFNVGVERIFASNSPLIQKVELVTEGIVRRSKLYYLRELSGKKARIKARRR